MTTLNFYRFGSRLLTTVLVFLLALGAQAQKKGKSNPPNYENALLWEVSGKNLPQSSYLFGTFHLLNSSYVDSLAVVGEKFKSAQTIVGEMIMDSSMTMQMMQASLMKETTLDKLLKPEDYQLADAYMKELSDNKYSLALFNSLKPMIVQILLMHLEWGKMNPGQTDATKMMDIYFQEQAKTDGKMVVGLETMQDQITALFDQFTPQRQADMLVETVKKKGQDQSELLKMTNCYRAQDLTCITTMMYNNGTYKPEEINRLLDDRNKKWMLKLPELMQAQSCFVAVGAGHLVGENGLIGLLRKQGYTVKPLSTKTVAAKQK